MKKLFKFLVAFSAFILISFNMSAQKITVKGCVKDKDGMPIIAATVYETGNISNGTTSDKDGNWTLSLPEKAKITFSCLGYKDLVEAVGGRKVADQIGRASCRERV